MTLIQREPNWLAVVGNHWPMIPLNRVFRIVNGATPKSSDDENWNGEICWATPEDLGSLRSAVLSDTKRKLTAEGYAACGTTLMPEGSLLLSSRAPIGHLAIAGVSVCTNQGCKGLVPRFDDDSRFYYYVLLSAKSELQSRGQGATFQELSYDKLATIPVPRPALDQQRSIADFLDRETAKIDALMQKNVLLIRKLLEQEQAVISAAVTRGLDPTAALKQTPIVWLPSVPADWNAKRLKFAAKRESGHTPSRTTPEYWQNCNIAWVSLNDVGYLAENDYISETAKNINELGLQNSSARMLPAGTVILSRDATVGRCGILGQPMATSQHFVNYICGPELVPEYLLFVFRYAMQHEFMRLTMGSTLRTIGLPDVDSFAVPLPPVPEQHQIVAYVLSRRSESRAARQQLQRCNDLLGEYRSALVTAAVTGQIDVRNYEAQGVASCQ